MKRMDAKHPLCKKTQGHRPFHGGSLPEFQSQLAARAAQALQKEDAVGVSLIYGSQSSSSRERLDQTSHHDGKLCVLKP